MSSSNSGKKEKSLGQIDHHRLDWVRVGRAVYDVRHHYRYTYTGAVTDIKQRLVMVPPDRHGDQHLLLYRIEIRGAVGMPALAEVADAFGNRVCHVTAERVEHAIDFEACYRVERRAAAGSGEAVGMRQGSTAGPASLAPLVPPATPPGLSQYLQPTALTAPDARLRAIAGELAREAAKGSSGGEASRSSRSSNVDVRRAQADRAHDWVAGAISYQVGVTGVQTPAAMALHFGRGVCQDYAHLLLCLLRLLGIPARYVSGHLLGEGVPHAWVEALFEAPWAPDGIEVVAYDPTHRRPVGLNYVSVAIGRDFADVTPTSGVFSGPAAGKLSWTKVATAIEVEWKDGRVCVGVSAPCPAASSAGRAGKSGAAT